MDKETYIISQVLNHNSIICKSTSSKDSYIFFGKGIGFKKKAGEFFNYSPQVENALLTLDTKDTMLYRKLIETVESDRLIMAVQEVVQEAHVFFNHRIKGNLNLSLLDHLNFAIERQKQNYMMHYPFQKELQFIYPKEYEFCVWALAYINEQMKDEVRFDDSELGFLTLHIHAAISNEHVSKVVTNNMILYECTSIIEDYFHTTLDRTSIYYARFIKHLEYAVHRAQNKIKLQNVLLSSIKETCRDEFIVATQINLHLNKKYHIFLDENEIGYLAIHIYNLKSRQEE